VQRGGAEGAMAPGIKPGGNPMIQFCKRKYGKKRLSEIFLILGDELKKFSKKLKRYGN